LQDWLGKSDLKKKKKINGVKIDSSNT
jgi:hypothetical protein